MSRSYKKFPVCKERCRTSEDYKKPKTFANRAVRHYPEIPGGRSGFKKIYCSWNICDYRFYLYRDEREFQAVWNRGNKKIRSWFGDDYEEALNYWKKYYVRK